MLVAAGPENENPLEDIFPSEADEAAPSEKPDLPIDPAGAGGLDGSVAVVDDFASALSPGVD